MLETHRVLAGLLVTMLAVPMACKREEDSEVPDTSPTVRTDTTLTQSYTIEGTGAACVLELEGDPQPGNAVDILVTGDRYVTLKFSRASPLLYFQFEDQQTHHVIERDPLSGTATDVSVTFDIPFDPVGTHVDEEAWAADTGSPPCRIKVTIKRE